MSSHQIHGFRILEERFIGELVKELCEGLSLNNSLETLESLSRGFDLLHARIEKVCVLKPRATERKLVTSR